MKLAVLRGWPGLGLVLIGLTSQLLYMRFFLKPYSLLTYYDVPLLEMGKISGRSFQAAFDFATAFFLLFVLFFMAYLLSQGETLRHLPIVVFLFSALCGLVLIFVYPITAADVFDYILQGRVMSHHGANPYLHAPLEFLGDPLLRYSAWPWITSPYGPLWSYVSAAITRFAGSSLLVNLLLFKLVALVIHLMNAGLIYDILARWRPSYALAGTLLYAWNPLVLFESAANGHNDGLMMFFVLLAIGLYLRRRFALAVPTAACALLVKLPTMVLVPLFFVAGWRALSEGVSRHRFAIVSVVLTVAVVLLLYAPFWEGSATLSWLERSDMFSTSFAAVAALTLRGWLDKDVAESLARHTVLFLFGLFYAWQIIRLRSEVRPFLFGLYWTVFVVLSVAVLWFQPWYLIWLVALGALLPSLRIAELTTLLCYSASWNYLVYIFFLVWYLPQMTVGENWGVNVVSVLLIFVPALAYAVYVGRRPMSV